MQLLYMVCNYRFNAILMVFFCIFAVFCKTYLKLLLPLSLKKVILLTQKSYFDVKTTFGSILCRPLELFIGDLRIPMISRIII